MALSRTARILIAVLLLAAAGFFWVNYFMQNPPAVDAPAPATPRPIDGGPAPLTGANGAPADAGAPTVVAPDDATGTTAPMAEGQGQPADAAGTADATAPGAAPVVVTPPAVVARDLVVEELPFLVTEPPLVGVEEPAEAEADTGRAVRAARANVNPFSPVLVQAPPAAPVAQQPPAAQEPQVVVVEGQPEPTAPASTPTATATRTPVAAPAPRALAPAPSRAAELPRPLPSGTLTAVPDILRDVRGQERAAAGPADLGAVAAVVVPSEESAAELPFAGRGAPAPEATASPDVIGPGHATQRAAASSTLPLAVGADPLSRYLRDNNVRFTGQVLGPLSVGVFRANGHQQPFVVTLGQTLPDTDIVLSDLRGYEASFSLGNQTQVLSLDTRR